MFANIYEQVNPSVVNVTVLGTVQSSLSEGFTPRGVDPDDFVVISTGSGFVWDAEGHIVTNNHVVEGAEQVQVTFEDGGRRRRRSSRHGCRQRPGGAQDRSGGLPAGARRRASLDDVHVGMRVVAIGNPFGLEGTLTSGIVSAIGRSIPARRLQHPRLNPDGCGHQSGQFGRAAAQRSGELIGVNAQIRSDVRSNSGVGFAIPVNIVERVVPALIRSGKYARSYMGISGGTLSPICADALGVPKTLRGALVLDVLPRTPADAAGLRGGTEAAETEYPSICPDRAGGDVIVAIEGEPVTKFDDVLSYLQRNTSPGDTVSLSIWRNGQTEEVELTLAPRPENATP